MSNESRSKSAQIKFWVTPTTKAAIVERARSAASLGDYLERVALQKPPELDRAYVMAALHALSAIRDAMQPAEMLDLKSAQRDLARLGNLQKDLYSKAKVPLDRIDDVAFHLRDAITRVEEAVRAALDSDRAAVHLMAAILRAFERRVVEKKVQAGVEPPDRKYAASLLTQLQASIDTLTDALGHRRE